MKASKISDRIILGLFVTLMFCLFNPPTVFCQMEKLGIVKYTPPKGWTKTPKENVVAFSELNQTTGGFCIITLYGATPGTAKPKSDFTREWDNLVVKTLAAEANPRTETQAADGWTITAGASEIVFQGAKSLAFLTVFSGGGKTVSVLGVFNNEAYMKQLEAFVGSIELDKAAAPNPPTEGGKLVIPLPTRPLTVADLTGEWGETAGFTTTYVDRYTGSYAGTDSLHFRSKMTITKNGGYINDFFAIRNGKKIIDKTSGTVTIIGRIISIKENNTAKYVVRGWLELPEMTIMTVCGPWYNDDVIPEEIFTNPEQGANLNKNWVRRK
ncbi:MAG: hypothetical protein H0W45_01150 [Acidobacteria bacterium]|jgi:hypothetical protein|nr:hypothetical protein [Acidobacteriota bacterium]